MKTNILGIFLAGVFLSTGSVMAQGQRAQQFAPDPSATYINVGSYDDYIRERVYEFVPHERQAGPPVGITIPPGTVSASIIDMDGPLIGGTVAAVAVDRQVRRPASDRNWRDPRIGHTNDAVMRKMAGKVIRKTLVRAIPVVGGVLLAYDLVKLMR